MFRSKRSKIVIIGILFILWLVLAFVVRNASSG